MVKKELASVVSLIQRVVKVEFAAGGKEPEGTGGSAEGEWIEGLLGFSSDG